MVYNFAKFHYFSNNRAQSVSNTFLIIMSFANNLKQEKALRMHNEWLPVWFISKNA